MSGDAPRFPVTELPGDARMQRLAGLYPQRQQGLYMQRTKILGGRLSAAQWRALGTIAMQFTPGDGLHLTTRQDIELHGVAAADVPAVQKELAAAGLTGLGACGDTTRNVTVCPCCGLCPSTRDMAPMGAAIRAAMESHPQVYSLPRKFKVSLSGCKSGCARPYISDIGFVAEGSGGLRVVGAGSLGARPGTGIDLYESVPPGETVAVVMAALELFIAEGDRTNRKRARLRHVRERLGDDAFKARLDELLAVERSRRRSTSAACSATPVCEGGPVVLRFPLGDITAEQALSLGKVAEKAEVRIGLDHWVAVWGMGADQLPDSLAAATGQPRIVCCPGADSCASAIAHSRRIGEAIRREWGTRPLPALTVKISGCPNGCAHSAVADIGLLGRRKGEAEFWQMVVGGGDGKTAELSRPVGRPIPEQEVAQRVISVATAYGQRSNWDDVVAMFPPEGDAETK